jgi:hypothetical protein
MEGKAEKVLNRERKINVRFHSESRINSFSKDSKRWKNLEALKLDTKKLMLL